MAADDTRRWIAAAALVGFALRLAFGLVYWTHQPLTRDEREYLSLARSLAAGSVPSSVASASAGVSRVSRAHGRRP